MEITPACICRRETEAFAGRFFGVQAIYERTFQVQKKRNNRGAWSNFGTKSAGLVEAPFGSEKEFMDQTVLFNDKSFHDNTVKV